MPTPDETTHGVESDLLPGTSLDSESLYIALDPVAGTYQDITSGIRDHINAHLADGNATRDLMHEAIQDNLYAQLANVNHTVNRMYGKVGDGIISKLQPAFSHAMNLGLPIPATHAEVRQQLALPVLDKHMYHPDLAGQPQVKDMPFAPPDTEYWVGCQYDPVTGGPTPGMMPRTVGVELGHKHGDIVHPGSPPVLIDPLYLLLSGPYDNQPEANAAEGKVQCPGPTVQDGGTGQPIPQPFIPPQPPVVVPVQSQPCPPPNVYCPPIPPCPPPQVIVNLPKQGTTKPSELGNGEPKGQDVPLPDLSGPENFANILFNLQGTSEVEKFVAWFGEAIRPTFEAENEQELVDDMNDDELHEMNNSLEWEQ